MTDQRILVIDGHPVYAHKTIGFLQGLTFKDIQLAQTGKQGMDEVRFKKPDLVILSSMLPDMDSLDVCRQINELAGVSVKIIVQTGLFMDEEAMQQFRDCGADVLLMRKEKDLNPLQTAVEQLLSSKVS